MARASVLKKDIPFSIGKDPSIRIQTYGEGNDFPQQVVEIVEASATGSACRDIYAKFLQGRGFDDERFFKLIVNRKGQTMDAILKLIAWDNATFNGWALSFNFNANYKIREIFHVPFENVRLCLPDDNGEITKAAIHWDWGKRHGQLKKWDKKDIQYIDIFNPDQQYIQSKIDTWGWERYNGQLFYSGPKTGTYPTPIFTSVLTDMNTEEGLSNISNRNSRNRFMLSGFFVDIYNEDESESQSEETVNMLTNFQGDEDAQKIGYINVKSADEVPQFLPLETKNYDKDYTVTEETCRSRIGRRFNQPPILRSEQVAQGFSVEAMQNAYDFYNSVTEPDRQSIQREMTEIFKHWAGGTVQNTEILALSYVTGKTKASNIPQEFLSILTIDEKRELIGFQPAEGSNDEKISLAERIGVGGTQSITAIISDPNVAREEKIGLLKVLFNLSDEQINLIFPVK